MDARKHARKIAARHMEQTGRCPYGVVTVDGGEFVEAHRPHRPADPRLGLRRDLGHPVGRVDRKTAPDHVRRSEEHTSELQSLMRISYAVFCLKKKKNNKNTTYNTTQHNTIQHPNIPLVNKKNPT